MQNGTKVGADIIGNLPTGWNVIGIGDFNGDGTSDLLLQNGSALGDWQIRNGTYANGDSISTLPSGWTPIAQTGLTHT